MAGLLLPLGLLTISAPLLTRAARSAPPHLCKCTCFSSNTAVVPILVPQDLANPCATCTRQFCLDQNLPECKGARIQAPDVDTGTGWEGDVWAKCFKRDSHKDRSIILFYLLTVLGLLLFTVLRHRVGHWYESYRTKGTAGVYEAVRNAAARPSNVAGSSRR